MPDCKINSWKYCKSGASSWTKSGAPTSVTLYAGGDYVACVTFTTPNFQGISKQVTLKFNVVRISSGNTSTSLYCKIGTVNPGSTPLNPYTDSAIGALGSYTTMSCSGITYNSQQFTHTFNFTQLQPNKTYYLWIYGGAGVQLYKHASYNAISIGSTNQTYTPKSITRSVSYSGFYGSSQSFTATSSTAGQYLVTTGSPSSSSSSWYKKSSSNATSCTFTIDKDTSTTALYKTYHLTVIPNCNSTYVGTSSKYKTFYAPRYALKLYARSGTPVEINSKDYSTLPSSYNNPEGYTLVGFASSSTSTTTSNSAGSSWTTALNGVTRYAVYKKNATEQSVTLDANGGSLAVSAASKNTTAAWIYGTGQSSGGVVSYYNSTATPTRSGCEFLGWGKTSSQQTADYATARDALDDGYTGTLYAIWSLTGGIRIFTSATESSLHTVHIYNGSSWDKYVPYIYNGSSWVPMG